MFDRTAISQNAHSAKRDAFQDIRGLSDELGVPVRNLDDEIQKSAPSPPWLSPSTSASEASMSKAGSRWSLFSSGVAAGKKLAFQTIIPNDSASKEGSAAPASTQGTLLTPSPRSAGNDSTFPSESIPSNSESSPISPAQAQSKWFLRFGAKRANSNPASASVSSTQEQAPVSAPRSSSSSFPVPSDGPAVASKASTDLSMLDDFSQLENFDSRGDTGAAPRSNAADTLQRKVGWSLWNRQRTPPTSGAGIGKGKHSAVGANGEVSHANANDGEPDLDNIFEAFNKAPPGSAEATLENNYTDERPKFSGLPGPDDRFGLFEMASTPNPRIKSQANAKVELLDPFDPLAVRDAPRLPPREGRSVDATMFHGPALALQTSAARPPPRLQSPPLLAPPPSTGMGTRRNSTSLLQDFGNFSISPAPSLLSPPTAEFGRPNNATAPPAVLNPPTDDDFGDFETSSGSLAVASKALQASAIPQKKDSISIKAQAFSAARPERSGTPLSVQDLDFFDSL